MSTKGRACQETMNLGPGEAIQKQASGYFEAEVPRGKRTVKGGGGGGGGGDTQD